MPNETVQVEYDTLENVAKQFDQISSDSEQMIRQIVVNFDKLQGGGWQGAGAEAFFAEMQGELFPAFDRLVNATDFAGQTTRAIIDVMQASEQEAANQFQIETFAGAGGEDLVALMNLACTVVVLAHRLEEVVHLVRRITLAMVGMATLACTGAVLAHRMAQVVLGLRRHGFLRRGRLGPLLLGRVLCLFLGDKALCQRATTMQGADYGFIMADVLVEILSFLSIREMGGGVRLIECRHLIYAWIMALSISSLRNLLIYQTGLRSKSPAIQISSIGTQKGGGG